MKLRQVTLTNVGIIRSLVIPFHPEDGKGTVVLLRGKNGTGKTTVIRSILATFDGGSNPDLIGPAGEKAVVELEFDNGDRFRRTETQKGYELKGWSSDGSIIKSPAKTLQQYASGLALNPAGLVHAVPKDRVKFLQDAMPLEFTVEDLIRAGIQPTGDVPRRMNLERFLAFRDGRYEKRRELNVEVRDLRATRQTVAQSLPGGDLLRVARSGSQDLTAAPETIRAEVAAAEKSLESRRHELESAEAEWRATHQKLSEDLNRHESNLIAEARRKFEAEVESIRLATRAEKVNLDAKYSEVVSESRKPFDAAIAAAQAEVGAARERLEQHNRLEGVRQSIAQLDERITAKESEAVLLDEQVKALDALRLEKLNSQPIPGVEIRDGRIFWNGLDFETQVNKARQYVLSMQVASLTVDPELGLPFMVLDEAEAFDETTMREFCEAIKDSPFQVLAAEVVDDKPLEVAVV